VLNGTRPENQAVPSIADVPVLKHSYPAKVTSLHQIETSSFCSLRCPYCVSPNLERPKLDLSQDHFLAALDHVSYYVAQGTQHELNLAGIGESTEHPDFINFLRLAREAVGWNVNIIFATNGLSISTGKSRGLGGEELIRAMVPYKPSVFVSMHEPRHARIAIELYEKHGLLKGVSQDPVLNSMDWGGKVEQHGIKQRYIQPCTWLRQGWTMAMADGRVTACCFDGSGEGVIGHVKDPIGSLKTKPWSLCGTCHQEIGVEGYTQRPGSATKKLPVVE
jgi:hypothetical protein